MFTRDILARVTSYDLLLNHISLLFTFQFSLSFLFFILSRGCRSYCGIFVTYIFCMQRFFYLLSILLDSLSCSVLNTYAVTYIAHFLSNRLP